MVTLSSVRSPTSSATAARKSEVKAEAPAAPARPKPAAAATRETAAAPRPSREVVLDARRAFLGAASTSHLRAQLDDRLSRGRVPPTDGTGPAALRGPRAELAPTTASRRLTTDAPGPAGRRTISVDDPLAALGDSPSGRMRHASMRRELGKTGPAEGNAKIGAGLAEAVERLVRRPEGFNENSDGSYTFTGTSGDDRYTVTEAKDGSVVVTNDATGATHSLTAEEAAHGVTIRAGSGDDRITVDGSVRTPLALDGGKGDDRIDAQDARDDVRIEGGSGNDVLRGGAGNDAISGGDGDDRIYGGDGDDQLLGQGGDDSLSGMDGEDYLQGGEGADRALGGRGSDAIYADRRDTRIDAGEDDDVDLVVAEEGSVDPARVGTADQVHEYDPEAVDEWLEANPELAIDGSQDFIDRTRADLGVMLGTEQGRGLLNDLAAELRDDGDVVTLREKPLEAGAGGSYGAGDEILVGQWSQTYADGTQRMPLPVLFHELVHAYQNHVDGYPEGSTRHENGEDVRNLELQATGLPWYDASGALHPANEFIYTDNKFREELGLPPRTRYGNGDGAPTEHVAGDGGSCCDHSH